MDAVVSQILQARDPDALRKYLDSHVSAIKHHPAAALTNAISALDPHQHTLGLSYLLCARGQVSPIDDAFIGHCAAFLDGFNATVARDQCPEKLCAVARRYADYLRTHGRPHQGVYRLGRVLDAFAPGPEFLTPVHADFVLLAILAKNYKAARAVLERPIFEIDPRRTALTPRDFLLYYYYGARAWAGLKEWHRVYEFTQTAITIPGTALSAIAVEAFKIFVLASLITRGKFDTLPKQCSTLVSRHIKKYAPEYVEFATAYTKRQPERLEDLVTKHRDVFQQDHNLGMVEHAVQQYTRQAIQRLTSTYLTLYLSDIATQLRLPSARHAEDLLVQMVQTGELAASINQRDGMVVFEDSDRAQRAAGEGLEAQLDAVRGIVERLQAMDDDMVASREYVTKQIIRDPHLRDELEQALRTAGAKGKVRGMFETLFKG